MSVFSTVPHFSTDYCLTEILGNSYNDNQLTNQLIQTIVFQNQSQLSSINQNFIQLVPNVSQQHISYNYNKYQEIYDTDRHCTDLLTSVATQAFPPTNHNFQNQTFEVGANQWLTISNSTDRLYQL